jgi:hypothetical protein
MFAITTTIDCYLLPEDGAAARALFLQHLEDPYEMWIVAYSFTLVPMIDEIIKNSTGGAPIHIYLDLSQSSGAEEKPEVARLVAAGVEVTLGTSPAGTSYITHTKGVTCSDVPQPWCWEGSVNFSASGWLQVNTAMFFHSQPWHQAFVAQFDQLRDYAWTNLRSVQLMKEPPPGVTIGPSADPHAPAIPSGWQTSARKAAKAASSRKAAKAASSEKAAKAASVEKAAKAASGKKAARTAKKAEKKSKRAAVAHEKATTPTTKTPKAETPGAKTKKV